ncbi:MAG: glycosyltransferase family 2 protein [Candidatus Omnitrophota bacterium]
MENKCDIVLLSYESPDLLKKCVRSVLDHTRVKSRLIIVDNNSRSPEVKKYIEAVDGNETVEIEKVFNNENLGFAAGMNEGMRLSGARFVCLLNNDCVVTDGWLEEMIAVALKRSDIGLVNPQSNTFGSRPDEHSSIDVHAASLAEKRGKFVELGHIIGFACLVKREVIDDIGYLDEVYEGVCYEDTDFSVRARKAGFIPVMAEGSYVFHVEQASRGDMKGKKEVYRRNKEIFENKWGKLLRVLYVANGEGTGLSSVYDCLKPLTRERVFVDIWTSREKNKDVPEARHADISIKSFPGAPGPLAVLFHAVTKKKKYDAIIFEKTGMQGLFSLARFLHKAELFGVKGGSVETGAGEEFSLEKSEEFASYLRRRKKNA